MEPNSNEGKENSNRSRSTTFNLQGAQFGGGIINADTINASHIGDNYNNYSSKQQQNSTDNVEKQKILIIAAIPRGLRTDVEIREIEEAIQRAANRDLFEIEIRTAVRPQDIMRAVGDEEPYIVHFCGHGVEDGSLLLEDDGGNPKPVQPEGLAALFELYEDKVKCVVLNACHSEKTAIAISQHINYAIGMNHTIKNKAATAFSRAFYDCLGRNKSGNQDIFQRAFKEGKVAIMLENLTQGSIPSIHTKQV